MTQHDSPAWLALSRHTGDGREAPEQDMSLTFGWLHGELLCWQDALTGARLLTTHEEWLHWVAELAPARSCHDYTPALQQILACWAFTPLGRLLGATDFSPALQETTSEVPAPGLTLTLRRQDKQLTVLLQQADWGQLLLATLDWYGYYAPAVSGLPVTLVIGHSTLTLGQCGQLHPGSGLLLHAPDLAGAELWLAVGDQQARARLGSSGHLHLLSAFETTVQPVLHPERDTAMDNIPLKLTAEIGDVSITLGELQQLQPGDILQNVARLEDAVRLTVNGHTIARGHLVQAGDGWLIRISSSVTPAVSTQEEAAWTP